MIKKQSTRLGVGLAMSLSTMPVWAQDGPIMPQLLDTAECYLSLEVDNAVDWRGPYGRGYEVFDPSLSFEVALITVRHEGRACDFFLTATGQNGGGEGRLDRQGYALIYDLLRDPNGPSILSPDLFGNQLSRLHGTFAEGPSAQQFMIYLSIPPEQFVPGGTYSGQAILKLFRDDMAAPELSVQEALPITVPVASALKVENLQAGVGRRDLSVDLGNLETGATSELDFVLSSNAPVQARISSDNLGFLAHQFGARPIPYRMSIGNRRLDLSNGSDQVAIGTGGERGLDLPLRVMVDQQPGAAAGKYSDIVTINFRVEQ
ncbi:hypothetical protein [Qipengyuania pacifica]|uniref:hypothetical protein n=1 Tax=Qipengyuania pacifica TaxID=2860199 RepID=UPI001C9D90AF|nr:hypothetical protein [Qipengyuania pacifica]MBY8332629.1 hypothetical protein [Qipengyuania pacifica]